MSGDDRLSELPDSLIFDIFQFLPTTDVVGTTILSKRWRNLSTTVPWLDFNDSMITNTDHLRKLVDGAIRSWGGTKLVRFKVEFSSKLDKSLASDIDSWMRFVVEKNVENLLLRFPLRKSTVSKPKLHLVPQCLYSCSSLKDLRLRSFDLQIHGNVQWDQLKKLSISSSEKLGGNVINQVLLGSPQLECFYLTLKSSKENLSIRSTSLKWLFIYNYLFKKKDFISMDTEVRIWTPNLKTLLFRGVPFSKCLLMDVSSLTKACLRFYVPLHYGHDLFPGTDFVVEALAQILPSIKHVLRVVLSNCCIKALRAVKEKPMISSFSNCNANFLELKVFSKQYEQIVGVVEIFPKLRTLVLETTYRSTLPNHAAGCFEFDGNLGSSFLRQLRTVGVTWTMGDESIFPLIQFLLKHAHKLEKMVIRKKQIIEDPSQWKSLSMQLQKLLRMQRSSPAAELILI